MTRTPYHRLAALALLAAVAPTPAAVRQPGATLPTVAGPGRPGRPGDGAPATRATLNQPFHCDLDGQGNLYIAEADNHCVRKLDLKTGVISTAAGSGKKGYTGDGGDARQA